MPPPTEAPPPALRVSSTLPVEVMQEALPPPTEAPPPGDHSASKMPDEVMQELYRVEGQAGMAMIITKVDEHGNIWLSINEKFVLKCHCLRATQVYSMEDAIAE